jgi:hypothetical protein
MDELSKLVGENGCEFLDSAKTSTDVYMIHVLADAVFTVLKEAKSKGDTGVDVLSHMNLSGKTIPAGAIITPYKEIFTDVTVTTGSVMLYKLGK